MSSAITRRQLLLSTSAMGLGLLAGCGRLPWQGQPAKLPRIGMLSESTDPGDADNAAFRQGLQDLGYFEGQNITLEWKAFDNRDQLPELAADLARRTVDVIVAQGTAATGAAKTMGIVSVVAFIAWLGESENVTITSGWS